MTVHSLAPLDHGLHREVESKEIQENQQSIALAITLESPQTWRASKKCMTPANSHLICLAEK